MEKTEVNAPQVIIPTPNDLHKLMDEVKRHLDTVASERTQLTERFGDQDNRIVEVVNSLKATEARWLEIDARLNRMDGLLPKGPDKRYIPVDGAKPNSEMHERMARFFLDAMCYAKNHTSPFKSEEFKRAIDTVGQTITGDGTQGGYLVPPEFRQEIQRIAGIYGVVRRLFRILPVARQTVYLPTHTSGPEVQWVDEAQAPTDETHVRLGRISLDVKRLMAIDNLSIEITEDSIPMITDFIIEVFAEVVAKEEDRVGLVGSTGGGDPFNGVANASGVHVVYYGDDAASGKTAFDNIAYDDLVNTMDAVNEFVADQSVWVASNSMFNAMRKIRDDSGGSGFGRPLWTEMVSGNPGTILGRPYVKSAVMRKRGDSAPAGKTVAIYGDFRKAIMGQRKEMEISFSEHADFRRGNITMRLMERVGFVTALSDAFTVLKIAST